mmetsp:Transcript_6920/g.27840  ORF Transcript_6920/g.27840 Transcript_6920/m.27840 type:complete len:696 (-) Transcript_6920:605-2692(-)
MTLRGSFGAARAARAARRGGARDRRGRDDARVRVSRRRDDADAARRRARRAGTVERARRIRDGVRARAKAGAPVSERRDRGRGGVRAPERRDANADTTRERDGGRRTRGRGERERVRGAEGSRVGDGGRGRGDGFGEERGETRGLAVVRTRGRAGVGVAGDVFDAERGGSRDGGEQRGGARGGRARARGGARERDGSARVGRRGRGRGRGRRGRLASVDARRVYCICIRCIRHRETFVFYYYSKCGFRVLRVSSLVSTLVNLHVRLREVDLLRQHLGDAQILRLVPIFIRRVVHHGAIRPVVGRAVVHDVGDQIVRRRIFVPSRHRDVIGEVQPPRRKRHDGRVLFDEEVVLGEARIIHDQVVWELGYLEPAPRLGVRGDAVEFLQQRALEGDLRDDVLLHDVLKQRRVREVHREHEERRRARRGRIVDDFHFSLETRLNDGSLFAAFLFVANQFVEQPTQELRGVVVPRLRAERVFRSISNRLHELVRARVTFKISRVPNLLRDVRQGAIDVLAFPRVVEQQRAPQRRHSVQRLQHRAHAVVAFAPNRVQSDDADEKLRAVQRAPPHRSRALDLFLHVLFRVRRREHVSYPRQRRPFVHHLVPVRQAPRRAVGQAHEHVMSALQRVRVRVRILSSSREVLAADQAPVHVHGRQRHRAPLLKVKIQVREVHRVQVRARRRPRGGRRRFGRIPSAR